MRAALLARAGSADAQANNSREIMLEEESGSVGAWADSSSAIDIDMDVRPEMRLAALSSPDCRIKSRPATGNGAPEDEPAEEVASEWYTNEWLQEEERPASALPESAVNETSALEETGWDQSDFECVQALFSGTPSVQRLYSVASESAGDAAESDLAQHSNQDAATHEGAVQAEVNGDDGISRIEANASNAAHTADENKAAASPVSSINVPPNEVNRENGSASPRAASPIPGEAAAGSPSTSQDVGLGESRLSSVHASTSRQVPTQNNGATYRTSFKEHIEYELAAQLRSRVAVDVAGADGGGTYPRDNARASRGDAARKTKERSDLLDRSERNERYSGYESSVCHLPLVHSTDQRTAHTVSSAGSVGMVSRTRMPSPSAHDSADGRNGCRTRSASYVRESSIKKTHLGTARSSGVPLASQLHSFGAAAAASQLGQHGLHAQQSTPQHTQRHSQHAQHTQGTDVGGQHARVHDDARAKRATREQLRYEKALESGLRKAQQAKAASDRAQRSLFMQRAGLINASGANHERANAASPAGTHARISQLQMQF